MISICIVTYNHEEYIEDCIMSVIGQSTKQAMEVLVGVDKSSDGTLAIVQKIALKFPKVVRCIEHEKRLGDGATNLQLVLQEASGRFIAHLDGDDLWRPGKLEAQGEFLLTHPNCPAVYTNAIVISGPGTEIGRFTSSQPGEFSLDYLVARGNFLNHSSILYRSEFKQPVVNLDAPFIDYQVHLLLAQKGNLGFINEALVTYRIDSPLSVRHTMNEHIRELYWQALMSMDNTHVSSQAFLKGKSEVLRQAFGSAIDDKSPAYFLRWWKRVSATEASRKLSLLFYTLVAITRRLFISKRTKLQQLGILRGEIIYYIR